MKKFDEKYFWWKKIWGKKIWMKKIGWNTFKTPSRQNPGLELTFWPGTDFPGWVGHWIIVTLKQSQPQIWIWIKLGLGLGWAWQQKDYPTIPVNRIQVHKKNLSTVTWGRRILLPQVWVPLLQLPVQTLFSSILREADQKVKTVSQEIINQMKTRFSEEDLIIQKVHLVG